MSDYADGFEFYESDAKANDSEKIDALEVIQKRGVENVASLCEISWLKKLVPFVPYATTTLVVLGFL